MAQPQWGAETMNKKRDVVVGSIGPITGTYKILTDLTNGKAWSLMELGDLTNCVLRGTSVEETAEFLCRDVEEVRAKIAELKTRLDGYV
jgi:hypothetical protein